ncbi:MAG: hypothetical protein OD918_08455 [Gammaproteobacteria bacterium]
MKHRMKPLWKRAAAMLLFAGGAPLHAHASVHTMGFTEAGKGMPFITSKAVPPVATRDASPEFRLDLHFGADSHPVLGIAPLIHYNSRKLEVVGISNIAHDGLFTPRTLTPRRIEFAPPTITIADKPVVADTDGALPLIWLDTKKIAAIAGATAANPVRIATITFKWKAGATGDSHIALTQNAVGIADVFAGTSIAVQSPRLREFSLDVDASGRPANHSDATMITRYILGRRGAALTKGLSNANADDVAAAIQGGLVVLDVDSSGSPADSSDAIMITRYFQGVKGAALTKGVSSARPAKVKSAIEALL